MIAVFVSGSNAVSGWLYNAENSDELDGLDYILFDELPEVILNNTSKRFLIDRVTKEITVYEEPPRPKTEIELLREENIDLKSRMDDLEMFAADIISGGGI
jgi:hypothetical protein